MKFIRHLFLILPFLCFGMYAKAIHPKAAETRFSGGYGFIENKGQILDQFSHTNKEVLYLYNGSGLNVQLRKNGFSYELFTEEKKNNPDPDFNGSDLKGKFQRHDPEMMNEPSTYKIHRVDISFEGADKNAALKAFDQGDGLINYYTAGLGESGVTGVHHYQKILYSNIYPGIDVEFVLLNDAIHKPACRPGRFKYNFIIHPGGNINEIRLKFEGATSTKLDEAGNIIIETAYGNIEEKIPYSYQYNNDLQKKEITARFSAMLSKEGATSNVYSINAGDYDPAQTLVIDPSPWATYYGGAKDDQGHGIAVDLSGNVMITGSASSTNNIATSGAYQTTLGGTTADAFIAKFNNAGVLQWGTYFGGSGTETGYGIATDANGNIFSTGATASTNAIATSGAYQAANGGTNDAYIVKLNAAGQMQWATYFGGTLSDVSYAIAIDLSGNIAIGGSTSSTNAIAGSGAYQSAYGGGSLDAFIAKFNSSGNFIWSTYLGGISTDVANSIAIDLSGNVLVGGYTTSLTGISTTGSHQVGIGGGTDAFITKFSAAGAMVWSTYYGGSNTDDVNGICTDLSGNIIVAGHTSSLTGIATAGAYQTSIGGGNNTDVFIAKFSPLGACVWATYFGATSTETAYNVCIDPNGNIYICGSTGSSSGIVTTGAYQSTLSDSQDALIAKFSAAGMLQMATYFGGSSGWVEYGEGVCSDLNGSIFVVGVTHCDNLVATPGSHQSTYGGLYEAFLFAIPGTTTIGPIQNNMISGTQGICTGAVPLTLTGSTPTGGNGTYTYSWLSSSVSAGSGFTPASGVNNTISYSPPALGSNTWYKRVVNSATYSDTSNVIMITVSPNALKVGFTVNKLIQCIKGNNFIFTDTTTSSLGNIVRLWTFGNGDTSTAMSPNISYTFNVANSYIIKLIASINGACADSATVKVYLNNNPVTGSISGNINVTKLTTETYSVPATIGSSYHWMFTNGNGVSSTNSINIKWLMNGTITLKLLETSGGGCLGDTVFQTITINPSSGIEEAEGSAFFKLYPNPNQGILHLQCNDAYAEVQSVEVINMMGSFVQTLKIPTGKEAIFDVSDLADGMYYLLITLPDHRIYRQRFMLESSR